MSSAHITFDTTGDKIARRVRKMRPSAVRNLFAAATRDDVISLSGGMAGYWGASSVGIVSSGGGNGMQRARHGL